ncbi:MAG: helix-turn-helix transcriptional regulator [Limnobacter sp.]|uniref:helix-turn-helix transcriptional regulator n=1 Tax=Limnobacter sp. TaxID=2003368 RepID=UPI0040378BA8
MKREPERHLNPMIWVSLERLGQRIKLARLIRNLTQKQVAERAMISVETVRGIERGEPIGSFCGFLGILQALGASNQIDYVFLDDPTGTVLMKSRVRKRAAPIKPPEPIPYVPIRQKPKLKLVRKAPVEKGEIGEAISMDDMLKILHESLDKSKKEPDPKQ